MSGPLLALAGPTASGKTALALALAERWPVEIISVDSALVYRGMDIGTAKPAPAELAAVPHHLIDIRDPREAYSAAEFCRDAARLVAEIRGRGRLPLMVGGTMLYLKAWMDGLDDMPAAHPEVRERIAQDAARLGWPALHARLAEVDPELAARLQPRDSQRIARALEVWEVAGQPLSRLQTGRRQAAGEPLVLMSLEPQDRAWLHERIARRFEQMLGQGFLAEVQALMQRGDLHPDLPAMRCVGYRQAWQVLERHPGTLQAAHNCLPEDALRALRETGIAATRQLAKRQLTWLRSMPGRCVLACDAPGLPARALAEVARHWPD